MKKNLLIILVFLFSQSINAQQTFQYTLGGALKGVASSIVKTSDGGFALTGTTYVAGDSGDVYVAKFSASNVLQWSCKIGGFSYDEGTCIIQSSDGGYAISARAGYWTFEAFIIKLDASGNLQWTQKLHNGLFDRANSIVQTNDGGFAIAGRTDIQQSFNNSIGYLIKLTANGTVHWTSYVTAFTDGAYSIIQTKDLGYLMAGFGSINGAGQDLLFVKTNANGQFSWASAVGGAGDETAIPGAKLVQANDGNYVYGGTTNSFGAGNSDMYVVKISNTGGLLWTSTIGGSLDESASSLIQSSDKGYVIAGSTNSFGSGSYDAYFAKLDSNGVFKWAKSEGGSGNDGSRSVIQALDSGYIFVGSSTISSGSINPFPFLFKINKLGAGCGNSSSGGTASSGGTLKTLSYQSGLSSSIASSGGFYTSLTTSINSICGCILPQVSISSGVPPVICPGGLVVLIASAPAGVTYQWAKNGTPISVGANNSNFSARDSGNYTCQVTNFCGTTVSNIIHVSMNAALQITQNPVNSFVCQGGSTSFSVAASGSSLVFQWLENGVTISNGLNYSGATTSTLSLLNVPVNFDLRSYSCRVSGSCAASQTSLGAMLSVGAVTPAISIVGPSSLCSGQAVTFQALPMNAGLGPNYQWKKNGVNIPGANSLTYSTNALINGDVIICTLTNNGSCSPSSTVTSNAITLAVFVLPLKPGAITGSATACALGSYTYSVKQQSGTTSYHWTLPAGVTISSGQGTHIIKIIMPQGFISGTISVVGTNVCGASSTIQSILVKSIPNAPTSISGLKSNLCGTSNVLYTTPPVPRAIGYLWTIPTNGSVMSTSVNSVSINYLNQLSGKLCVSASNTCGNSALYCSSVTLLPKQPVAISGPGSVCVNQQGVAYSCPTEPGALYSWTVPLGAMVASGQGTGNVTINFATTSGTIKVKPSNACGNGTSKSLTVLFSCREIANEFSVEIETETKNAFSVYPNPNDGKCSVTFYSEAESTIELTLLDLSGRVVKKLNYQSLTGNNLAEMNFSDLAKGFYYLSLKEENRNPELKKIMVK